MWILDTAQQQTPSVFSEFWHTLLVAIAVWLGQKFHVMTGGGNGD